MAVIQYTGIVNQVRGKLNGSVFNKARNVNTLQRKQQAPRRDVGFQSEPRNVFSNAQRSWKSLTNGQRTQWALAATNNPSRDRFGDLVPLSGYNQYIKAFMFASYAGVTPPTTPDTSPAPDAEFGLDSWTASTFSQAPSGAVLVDASVEWFRDNSTPGFYWLLDVGLPVSAGVTVYYGRYSFVEGREATTSGSWAGLVSLGLRYPMPLDGQYVYERIRVVYAPNGSVVYSQSRRQSVDV